MSTRTRFIDKQLSSRLSTITKIKSLGIDYLGRYASNVESDLRSIGKNQLSDRFLNELEYIGPGKPVRCSHEGCNDCVSYGARNPDTGKVYCREHEYLA